MKFYPVHTKRGAELTATERLNEQFPNRSKCPTRFNIRKQKVALWDCYTLIQLEMDGDIESNDTIRPIRSTPGVNQGLLRFGDYYPSIPDEIALASIEAPIQYEQAKQIRVLSGSFEHLVLDLESADKEKVKAWVTILGKPQLVEFQHENIVLI